MMHSLKTMVEHQCIVCIIKYELYLLLVDISSEVKKGVVCVT